MLRELIVDMGSFCRIVRMRLAGLLYLVHNRLVVLRRSIGVGAERSIDRVNPEARRKCQGMGGAAAPR
jgi:hypothetical protein